MSEDKDGLSGAVEAIGVGEPPSDEAEQLALLPLSSPGTEPRAPDATAQKRRGRGRPPGAKNKRTEEWTEYLLTQYQSPLITLAETYSRPVEDLATELGCKREEAFKLQLSAAKELARYVHQAQPQAIQVEGKGELRMTLGVSQEFVDMVQQNDRAIDEAEGFTIEGSFEDVEDCENEND